jgi:hypothetical protein
VTISSCDPWRHLGIFSGLASALGARREIPNVRGLDSRLLSVVGKRLFAFVAEGLLSFKYLPSLRKKANSSSREDLSLSSLIRLGAAAVVGFRKALPHLVQYQTETSETLRKESLLT